MNPEEKRKQYKGTVHRLDRLHLIRRVLFQKQTAGLPVYHGQPPLLEYIAKNPGCSQMQIAEEMSLTPASVALSTKRMEKAGLLVKCVDPDNLRCKRLTLTDKGRMLSDRCREVIGGIDRKMFAGFSDEEIAQLAAFGDRMLKNLSKGELAEMDMGSLLMTLERLCKNAKEEPTEQ